MKLGVPVCIAAQVDPPPVAAAEASPGCQRRLLCRLSHGVHSEAILDSPMPILLVGIGIDTLLRPFHEMDLQHPWGERLHAGPDDPNRELPPRQKGLDKNGLAISGQQPPADAFKLRPVL